MSERDRIVYCLKLGVATSSISALGWLGEWLDQSWEMPCILAGLVGMVWFLVAAVWTLTH